MELDAAKIGTIRTMDGWNELIEQMELLRRWKVDALVEARTPAGETAAVNDLFKDIVLALTQCRDQVV